MQSGNPERDQVCDRKQNQRNSAALLFNDRALRVQNFNPLAHCTVSESSPEVGIIVMQLCKFAVDLSGLFGVR